MKIYFFLALAVAALDQLVKGWIRHAPLGVTLLDIPGLVSLTHVVNTGAAFSMFSGYTALLAAVSILLLTAIWVYAAKRMRLTKAAWTALACLTGGGMGNLLDRIFYAGVTDYIRLRFIEFPVFNLADIAITGSIAVLLILLATNMLEESREDQHGTNG